MSYCNKSSALLGCGGCKYYVLRAIPPHLNAAAVLYISSEVSEVMELYRGWYTSPSDSYVTCDGKLCYRVLKVSKDTLGVLGRKTNHLRNGLRLKNALTTWSMNAAFSSGAQSGLAALYLNSVQPTTAQEPRGVYTDFLEACEYSGVRPSPYVRDHSCSVYLEPLSTDSSERKQQYVRFA